MYKFKATDSDPNAKLQYSIDSLNVIDEIGVSVQDPLSYITHFSFSNNGLDDGTIYLKKSFSNTTVLAVQITVKVVDLSHLAEPEDKGTAF